MKKHLLEDLAVTDDDGAVIRRGGEQRVPRVERHVSYRLLVVSEIKKNVSIELTQCAALRDVWQG